MPISDWTIYLVTSPFKLNDRVHLGCWTPWSASTSYNWLYLTVISHNLPNYRRNANFNLAFVSWHFSDIFGPHPFFYWLLMKLFEAILDHNSSPRIPLLVLLRQPFRPLLDHIFTSFIFLFAFFTSWHHSDLIQTTFIDILLCCWLFADPDRSLVASSVGTKNC